MDGTLHCRAGHVAPVIAGIPRLLPRETAALLVAAHPSYFEKFPLRSPTASSEAPESIRTLQAFGDEWRRFPELHDVHRRIFAWYFEGPEPVRWPGLKVLDAGCGMGRWLHFACEAGARVVGMDVSGAIDVAAARDGAGADFVQSDLRHPPFAPESFDLVYCLGVVHHLEDPLAGVRALAKLVRPGGELRLYVYRTLDEEPLWRRGLLAATTALRRVTTRLPYAAVHAVSWMVAATATVLFLWPRRVLRGTRLGDRLTRELPLVHYADVPFRMLVSEQFDRLVAPIEGRFSREQVAGWLRDSGLEVVAILPGLGWRAIAKRPLRG
jgi:2-polyprenyl-3-methyl-5-hydroxy-6-metoxy-1,4-benzoquinol methylase